jgi:hypothetical protein
MHARCRQQTQSSARKNCWRLAALLLTTLVFGLGCNPGTLSYMLMPWMDSKEPAEFPLAKRKQESTVIVLCNYGYRELRLGYQNVDKDLARCVTGHLEQRFKANGDKVKIVSAAKVRDYLNNHDVDDIELGKHFKADYVVVLDIQAINFFLNSSFRDLERGNVAIDITVVDVNTEDSSVWTNEYKCEYPSLEDIKPSPSNRSFQERFLNHIGKEVSRLFTTFPHEEAMEIRSRQMGGL